MKGVAPILSKYLVSSSPDLTKVEPQTEDAAAPSEDANPTSKRQIEDTEDIDKSVKPKKKRNRGQNKQREKFSNQRRDPADRLCKSFLCDTVCTYGDTCKFSHDVADFLSKKPEDISGSCYNFKHLGKCPYSFACRFGKNHIKEIDGEFKNIEQSAIVNGRSVNNLSKDNLILLRKHKYDFTRAESATEDARAIVQKITKRNFELNCVKKKDIASVQNESIADNSSEEMVTKAQETLSPNGNLETSNVGPITNEDEFTIKPKEKKTIDFKNKLYLAPLTTVGNLPFRRVCKTYGADITCGEMALATKLLQGVSSEWALVKRHSSEDLFGVQLCGAFADSMSKCTQLLTETCEIDFIDINVGCPIELIFDQGAGSALMRRMNRFHEIVHSMVQVSDVPITAKIRTGISETKNTADSLVVKLREWGITMTTLHGRSREQRYTKSADWAYIDKCAKAASPMPLYGGGDILSFEDYNEAMKSDVAGTMLARGALIKPWLFTEIKEQRHWDISSSERLDILRDFSNYGLEHWGSDHQGVETTRRFMLEWLSFLHRYIPVGILERLPQKINERPSPYFGRDDLETLMASPNSADWVKISEMLLGPVPQGFFFIPKHRANSYS
ncbi:tRNA-dihydrouridine(47) synthase [NAD(P)(+)]-like [Watersipora subatra]|uniref:tRNA-dihydrouridine(47) synthase [NAD(P)(+)]-like n=1 Tax=Watersipora subatra TaxID=2589382 RepID=UPI00355C6EBD